MAKRRRKKNEKRATAALAYVFVFWIIPLALAKKDKHCHFHGKQGMVLFGLEVMAVIFIGMISKVAVLGDFLLIVLSPIAFFFFLVVSLVGVYHASKGERWEMPVIGEFAKRIDF